MSARDIEIRTCASSLMNVGYCCKGSCPAKATTAVIYGDLVEHTRCDEHSVDDGSAATKPLKIAPQWTDEHP